MQPVTMRGHLRAGLPGQRLHRRHHHPDFEKLGRQAWRAIGLEEKLPGAAMLREQEWALQMGLPGVPRA